MGVIGLDGVEEEMGRWVIGGDVKIGCEVVGGGDRVLENGQLGLD
jgi:hypothetical protein